MKKTAVILVLIAFISAATTLAQTADTGKGTRAAVSYGFVVDNSGSYRLMLERVIGLVREIVEQNSAEDETFLVTFVDANKIFVRQEFTVEKKQIQDAADNMFIEGGQTAIFDALRLSAEYLTANGDSSRPRALILITDGDERKSAARFETIIALAKDSKIRIFAIGISDEKVNTKFLDRLVKETGGSAFYPKRLIDAKSVVEAVSSAIRSN